MGAILILERILSEVVSHQDPCVLFGKKDYVDTPEGVYDFFFHSLRVPFNSVSPNEHLAVPVLPIQGEDQAVIAASDLYKRHPHFATIALRDREPRVRPAQSGKKIISGTSLTFLDMKRVQVGVSIEDNAAEYTLTTEPEFQARFQNGSQIMDYIRRLREEINIQYKY